MLALIAIVLPFVMAAVSVVGMPRRASIKAAVVALALIAAFGMSFVARRQALLGFSLDASVALVPVVVACAAAYVVLVRRRFARATTRPLPVEGVIGAIVTGAVLLAGALSGRGRPDPGEYVPSCTQQHFEGGETQSITVRHGGTVVEGPRMEWNPATSRAFRCSLNLTTSGGDVTSIVLAPPFGLSGSFHCGTGDVFLCDDALLVRETPAEPFSIETVVAYRLDSHHATPFEATASTLRLAPPRAQALVAFGGLITTLVGLVVARRRATPAHAASPPHPYRNAIPEAAPNDGVAAKSAFAVTPTTAAALILCAPLAASLI